MSKKSEEERYGCVNCGFMTNGDFCCPSCGSVLCESCSDKDCCECSRRQEEMDDYRFFDRDFPG